MGETAQSEVLRNSNVRLSFFARVKEKKRKWPEMCDENEKMREGGGECQEKRIWGGETVRRTPLSKDGKEGGAAAS